jgi:hypothetical protein
MKEAPEAVCIYIPLMKSLGMSWVEIKETSRIELEGLMAALGEYNLLHSFDGYSEKDISEMAKNKPEVRSKYGEYVLANRRLREKLGQKTQRPTFQGLLG